MCNFGVIIVVVVVRDGCAWDWGSCCFLFCLEFQDDDDDKTTREEKRRDADELARYDYIDNTNTNNT